MPSIHQVFSAYGLRLFNAGHVAEQPDVENQLLANGRLSLVERVTIAHQISRNAFHTDMRTMQNSIAANYSYLISAGLLLVPAGAIASSLAIPNFDGCPRDTTPLNCPNAPPILASAALMTIPALICTGFVAKAVVSNQIKYLARLISGLRNLNQAQVDRFRHQQHAVQIQQAEDHAVIRQRPQRPVANQLNTNVHDHQRLTVARQQLQALLTATRTTQNIPVAIRGLAGCIREIYSRIAALPDTTATCQRIPEHATYFMQQIKSDAYFAHDFGDLHSSPGIIIMKLWQLFRSVEFKLEHLQHPPENPESSLAQTQTRAKYPLLAKEHTILAPITEPIGNGLLREMAFIFTDYANGSNPCGTGQISRLLNYSSSVLPELNLFKNKLTELPENSAIINEYIADITRQLGVLDRQLISDPVQQKSAIQAQFVDEYQLMTQDVFEHIFQRFESQLLEF